MIHIAQIIASAFYLFINDGKLYKQVYRHHMREEFYQEILYILVDFDR